MKNMKDQKKRAQTKGDLENNPLELNSDIRLVSTYTERIMEECELVIRRIDHVYNSAKEELELSFDKKEITPEVFFTLCEIRLQNYLKLISHAERKRDSLLEDEWGL